jgi:hypothetical protein
MWNVRLSDKQLEVLKALVRSEERHGPTLSRALEALELARWDELPDAQLPWDRVGELAGQQGISEADVVWDLAGKGSRSAAA